MAEQARQQTEFAGREQTWFRFLQFLLVILFASTAFLTGDGPAVAEGMTSYLVIAFLVVGGLWGIYHVVFPAVKFNRQWHPFLFSLTVLVMLGSVVANDDYGDHRAALNSWWQWTAFAVGITLITQLLHTEKVARGIVAVMVAIAVSLSSIGIYDSLVRIPELRREYFSGSDARRVEMLQQAGITDTRIGSPSRYHFESRIQSPEPHVTFALSNSLAGFLAPWFTLLLLLALKSGNRVEQGSVLPKLLVLAGVIAFCLVLTKSRSASCAVLLSILAGMLMKNYRTYALKAVGMLAGFGVVLLVLGLVTNRLDSKILTEAVKSLNYRMEYWESSIEMAADHLWLGTGPGNFRDHYVQYKQAAASESISDPHNWPLEILTSFGLPVLILMGIVFAAGYRRCISLSRVELESDSANRQSARKRFPDLTSNQLYFAGGAGSALGLLLDQLSYALIPLSVFYVALPCFAVVIFLLQDWVECGTLDRNHLLTAFLCWLLNLMVAGGISYPGVALSGWLLLGLATSGRSVTAELAGRVSMPLPQRWIVLIIMLGLPVVGFITFHRPVTLAAEHVMQARFYLQQNQLSRAQDHLQQAMTADPLGRESRILYANTLFMQLNESADEELLGEYKAHVNEIIRLNRVSQATLELFSQQALLLYRQYRLDQSLEDALEYTYRESELYPGSAHVWARLAVCQYFAGDLAGSSESIDRAFQLDQENPHTEFKLSNRQLTEAEFAGWRGRKVFFEKQEESVEQSLRYLRNKGKQQ